MVLKTITFSLSILLLLITKSKNDIPNCLFVNTVNASCPSNDSTLLSNYSEFTNISNLLATYDYVVLSNGNKVSVTPHTRRCICPDPCLSMCDSDPLETYNEMEEMRSAFERRVTLKNGHEEIKDLVKFFHFRFIEPCNEMYPLLMELYKNDNWSIFEDGTLLLHYDKSFYSQEKYCFYWKYVEEDGHYGTLFVPYVCSLVNVNYYQDQIKNWAMVCSIPFFVLTILFYCFLPELKSCHGKCFVMYLIYLTINYTVICYANISDREFQETECLAIGYIIYFASISFLTWISIISYDTFIGLTACSQPKLFRKYFYCGLIIPLVATIGVNVIQSLDIDDDWKPGIELGSCAVDTKRWSAALYYYVPHIIVLAFDLVMYIKIIRFLMVHERNVTKYTGKMKTSHRRRFSIYFRLFLYMGVVWFLEILSYFMYMILQRHTLLTRLPDLFNALHGLFIFFSILTSSSICRNVNKKLNNKRSAEHELMTTSSFDGALDGD